MRRKSRKIKPLKLENLNSDFIEEIPRPLTPKKLSIINNLFEPDHDTIEIFKERYNTEHWLPKDTQKLLKIKSK